MYGRSGVTQGQADEILAGPSLSSRWLDAKQFFVHNNEFVKVGDRVNNNDSTAQLIRLSLLIHFLSPTPLH
jgi:hypothetical protein